MRHLPINVAVLAAALVAAGVATASGPTMTLTPTSVKRGQHTVVIKGSAGGCAVGNTVFIISRAFAHTHEFAGVPAVLAKVKASGSYGVTTRIPARRKPIRFVVTARCGGGNFGITRHLTVRR
jgi:hypothetical protein